MQKQVRALAVKNARDRRHRLRKATRPNRRQRLRDKREEADFPGYTTSFGSGNGDGNGSDGDHNFDLRQPTAVAREITFSLGKITVEEKIYVTFELMK